MKVDRTLFSKKTLFEMIGYKPFPEQWEVHNSIAPNKTIRSGRRFGKSLVAAMDNIDLVLTPGTRGWIVGKTYALAEKEWRYILDALFGGNFFPKTEVKNIITTQFVGGKKNDNVTQGLLFLRFAIKGLEANPIEIVGKSWDKPDGLLGEELDWIIASEGSLMPREIWERFLRMTLLTRVGRFIIPSTSSDNSDLMDEFFNKGQNKYEKDYASWEFPAYCNPHWSEDNEATKEKLKAELSKEAYEEQVLGKKVHYTGRYYKEFDSEIHVGQLKLDRNREIYRSWDFGYRHPCIGWYQINKDRQILWFYTYLGTDIDDFDLALLGKYLSSELKYNQLPVSVRKRINKQHLVPFLPSQRFLFYDFCDAAGTQEKSSEGSAIKILNNLGIHPYYTAEKIQRDERKPQSDN
jgi:hypothetical protein